jgi:uncharacterized protein YecE (DUF72 family)
MKFGNVENPDRIDFSLPEDHPDTEKILQNGKKDRKLDVYVGCAKWNKQDLKNFYPRGTKDELAYYATQFNSIELNATFYRQPTVAQVISWRDKTPDGFKFFPKITQSVSHFKRLNNTQPIVEEFCDAIVNFEDKLGMVFLQLHNNFGYKNYDKLVAFIENFPKAVPLALEVRHSEWFNDQKIADELSALLEQNGVANILVDTAGRRDLLHMRPTTPTAFVRYVGANHPESEYKRLDVWLDRLDQWVKAGLQTIYFFVHQNEEKESPILAAYFIKKLNERFGTKLKVPDVSDQSQ